MLGVREQGAAAVGWCHLGTGETVLSNKTFPNVNIYTHVHTHLTSTKPQSRRLRPKTPTSPSLTCPRQQLSLHPSAIVQDRDLLRTRSAQHPAVDKAQVK